MYKRRRFFAIIRGISGEVAEADDENNCYEVIGIRR